MAPRNLTGTARPPETMHHVRLENEEDPLLPEEDQCSNGHNHDHEHGTTRKSKSFRDPSVGLSTFSFLCGGVHLLSLSLYRWGYPLERFRVSDEPRMVPS